MYMYTFIYNIQIVDSHNKTKYYNTKHNIFNLDFTYLKKYGCNLKLKQ